MCSLTKRSFCKAVSVCPTYRAKIMEILNNLACAKKARCKYSKWFQAYCNNLYTVSNNGDEFWPVTWFVDFKSTFNSVKTHIVLERLTDFHINSGLVIWIKDFHSSRPQRLCVSDSPVTVPLAVSDMLTVNTGCPQGYSMFFPLSYSLFF